MNDNKTKFDKEVLIGIDNHTFFALRNEANKKDFGISELCAKLLRKHVAEMELKPKHDQYDEG